MGLVDLVNTLINIKIGIIIPIIPCGNVMIAPAYNSVLFSAAGSKNGK
jgi:hypothetical protein